VIVLVEINYTLSPSPSHGSSRTTLLPSSVSPHLQDDRPKRRGNSGGSSGMRVASGPSLLEQRLVLPWAITPSKYIGHRGLRSAINCYAIRGGRDRERGVRGGYKGGRRRTAAISNASLLGHLIRFTSRYNVLHARDVYMRAIAPVNRNTVGARPPM